jgi:DNA polymerase-1
MQGLSFEEMETGVIFGFLRKILQFSQLYPNQRFIFAWDTKSSLREKIYPEYKGTRKKEKTEEEKEFDAVAYRQFDIIRKDILPFIGFKNSFWYEGFEADDVIARIIYSNHSSFVIVSGDEDMYQLLFDNIKIYNPNKKTEITEDIFTLTYGISADEWINVKAIAGCSSDNVKGIEGVGEKTAIKFLCSDLSKTSKLYEKITSEEGQCIIKRNIKLVRIPFLRTPNPWIDDSETLSLNNFMTVCQRYGFNSMLQPKELNKWERSLQMV